MLHELAHVRRRDSASQMLAATVCALYWFNPLVWLGARAMRAEAESAADDVVLGSGVRPSAYARELLRMAAELGGKTQPLPVAGVSIMKHSKIESRVVAILDGSRRRRAAGSLELLGALAIAMTAGLPLAILKPTIASTLRPVSLQKSSSDTKVIQDSPGEVKIVTTRVGDDAVTATVEMPRLKILARQSPPSPELKALMAKNAALQKKLKNRIPVVLKGYGPMTASLVRSLDAPVAGNMQAQRELNGRLRTLWAWFSRPDAAKSGGISKAAANAIVQSLKSDRPMIRELELDPVKVLTLDGGIDPKVVISDGGKPRYLDLKVRQSKDLKAITVQPDGIQIIGTLDKINADTIKANVGSADSAPRAVITTDGVTLQGDVKVGTAPRVIMLDSKDKAKTVTATADAKGTTSTITLDGVVSSDAKVGMIILDQGNPKLILKTDRQKVGQDKLDKTIQETIVTQVRDATRAQDAHPSIAELKKVIAALERASQAIKSRSGKDHQKDVTATVKMLEDIERQLREDMKKSGGK